MHVKLTYFRPDGSFFGKAEFEMENTSLGKTWDKVQGMCDSGNLPSTIQGTSQDLSGFTVMVEVPSNPLGDPCLILPKTDPVTVQEPDPVKRSFTKDELVQAATEFMVREEGLPKDLDPESRQEWRRDMGLLFQFCTELFVAGVSVE